MTASVKRQNWVEGQLTYLRGLQGNRNIKVASFFGTIFKSSNRRKKSRLNNKSFSNMTLN